MKEAVSYNNNPIFLVAKPHQFDIVFCGVYTSHHTLVIAKEEDAECSNTVDGDEKLTLLKVVSHIEALESLQLSHDAQCKMLRYMWSTGTQNMAIG